MSLELRILQPRDVDVLVNVASGVFDRPLVPQLVTEFLSDSRHHLAVAVDQGAVVGIASGVHYIHPEQSIRAVDQRGCGRAESPRERRWQSRG